MDDYGFDACEFDDFPDDEMPTGEALGSLRAFGDRTLITTDRGPVPAREITREDRLRTKTGEFVGIDWIERLDLDPGFLARNPGLRPVLICAGDLGDGPHRNVVMTREQMVWRDGGPAGKGFRRAADLSQHPDLFADRHVAVSYVTLMSTKPSVIEAEGLWVSLTP